MITIIIQAYDLQIRIESGESHPDHLTDLASRATNMFQVAVATMKAAAIPIGGADQIEETGQEE